MSFLPRALRFPAFLILCAASLAHAQPSLPAAEYGVRPDDANTGSNIRTYVLKSTLVPINRTWAQLTASERSRVRNWYKALPVQDEPPFPAQGHAALFESLKRAQAKIRARGELFLIASVGADGKVGEVRSASEIDRDMIKAAAELLAITAFKPAQCGGQPCEMDFPLMISFTN
jgi:hypothetical protein